MSKNKRIKNFPGLAFNITKKQVLTLLNGASSTRRNRHLRDTAKKLLRQINYEGKSFNVIAGGHAGGFGGRGRGADPNPHVTIEVAGIRYHLQYKFLKNNQLVLVNITG